MQLKYYTPVTCFLNNYIFIITIIIIIIIIMSYTKSLAVE